MYHTIRKSKKSRWQWGLWLKLFLQNLPKDWISLFMILNIERKSSLAQGKSRIIIRCVNNLRKGRKVMQGLRKRREECERARGSEKEWDNCKKGGANREFIHNLIASFNNQFECVQQGSSYPIYIKTTNWKRKLN